VHRYHSSEKCIDVAELLRKDIVLTTYATVAADFCRGRSTLNHIAWYRLVLDEGNYLISNICLASTCLIHIAHIIRNPSTKQYRAIQSIPANIRWCLTGTPIQNSLEDIGALAKFLRVPVLEELAMFRKHISTPVFSTTKGKFANLSRLLEALCLRRTKALLCQPEPATETRLLQFSVEENTQYHDYAEGCKHAIDMAVSGHSLKKANQHVIQAILGMRLFCNDGKRALTRRKHAHGLPIDPEEALSFLQTSGGAMCIECNCEITSMYQSDDKSSGILTFCQHLVCGECLPQFEADLDDRLEDGRSRCPICGVPADRSLFIVKPSPVKEQPSDVEIGEYPTKLRALLNNVQSQSASDKW
jgi:SWI/SNF-related matrix-associated actin-dependent regulator of chromatin subfamily A3